MTFEQKILDVVLSMNTSPNFIGGDWWKVNIAAESVVMPAVIYINPVSGSMEFGTQALDNPNVLIAFMNKVVLDADFSDTNSCVNSMKELMVEFVILANSSGYFYPIKEIRYEVTYDRLDSNLCGVILSASIKERAGIKIPC